MTKSVDVSASFLFRVLGKFSLTAVVVGSVASAQTVTVPQLLPYTTKVVAGTPTPAAGSGGTVKANPAAGGTCPSGLTASDAYGDGCLATEVIIGTTASPTGVRDAVADAQGNIFFGDYVNGIVHRVDAVTGVMTAVAGGAAASPQNNVVCNSKTTTTSSDAKGDGCMGTDVHLSKPTALVFGPNGDLYFGDYGYGEVRKITAALPVAPSTVGLIPATGGTISLVAGSPGTTSAGETYGYIISNATTTITGAQSVLDGPYGLSFGTRQPTPTDPGNLNDLFIVDEYTAAAVVLNTGTTSNTVNGTTIPAGTIWKIAGSVATTGATYPYCVNSSTSSSAGCAYTLNYTSGAQANTTYLDAAYGIAAAPNGNTYIANEHFDTILQVDPSGVLTTFAGINGKTGNSTTRAAAGSFAIGSPFGVAADAYSNVYFTDALDGTVWRVDANTHSQSLIASGFGSSVSSTTGLANTTLPGPGIFGISVDPVGNLFFGDTEKGTVTEISTGVEFGSVGALQPTQTLDVHFGANDGPSYLPPVLTGTGASNFLLGAYHCTANSDNTVDCTLPVTATPTTPGYFSATLTVTSTLGATNSFTLSGTYVQSPATRTTISYTATGVNCPGTNTFSTTTPIVITSTVIANGPSAPSGTITFYANNAQIGTPQNVVNLGTGTAAAPVYGAMLSNTFSTVNGYTLTATYSGDKYFTTSTSASTFVTTANPSITAISTVYQLSTVKAGGIALYSFSLVQNVFTGTVNFACSGLPAYATCSFSPTTVTATGCSTGSTVALSIATQGGAAALASYGFAGTGRWQLLGMIPALGLALLVGLRRRKLGARYGQIALGLALLVGLSSLMACSGTTLNSLPVTPKVSNAPITVTATASTGITSSFQVYLTVN